MSRTRVGGTGMVLLALLGGACDRFFEGHGRVVACGTTVPVAGAKIVMRIDKGYSDTPYVSMNKMWSDDDGRFSIGPAEPPSAWLTLTFTKDGFATLETQVKGEPHGTLEVCLTAESGDAPP